MVGITTNHSAWDAQERRDIAVVMDSSSVTGRRHKLRADSCGHYPTPLTKESRSMGRGNRLLRIHRFSGWVQPASEPVSAARRRRLYVRRNIAPEPGGRWLQRKP